LLRESILRTKPISTNLKLGGDQLGGACEEGWGERWEGVVAMGGAMKEDLKRHVLLRVAVKSCAKIPE